MSTFVVRILKVLPNGLRGRVRHVGSGEEATFSSYTELLAFLEELGVLNDTIGSSEELSEVKTESDGREGGGR